MLFSVSTDRCSTSRTDRQVLARRTSADEPHGSLSKTCWAVGMWATRTLSTYPQHGPVDPVGNRDVIHQVHRPKLPCGPLFDPQISQKTRRIQRARAGQEACVRKDPTDRISSGPHRCRGLEASPNAFRRPQPAGVDRVVGLPVLANRLRTVTPHRFGSPRRP